MPLVTEMGLAQPSISFAPYPSWKGAFNATPDELKQLYGSREFREAFRQELRGPGLFHGLWDLITGPFELPALPTQGGPYCSAETRLKYWPVEYNGQLPVWAALELRTQVDWRELADIKIGTYTFCYTEIGSEPEKWDPKTRETADHSLPYLFAKTLVDGTITLAAFEELAYRDPALRPLMAKIHVALDKEVDSIYPKIISMKITATTTDGRRIELWPRDPLGHVRHPMKDEDVTAKFVRTVEPLLGNSRTSAILQRWWSIPQASPSELAAALRLMDLHAAENSGFHS